MMNCIPGPQQAKEAHHKAYVTASADDAVLAELHQSDKMVFNASQKVKIGNDPYGVWRWAPQP
jgi:hypothetical protein